MLVPVDVNVEVPVDVNVEVSVDVLEEVRVVVELLVGVVVIVVIRQSVNVPSRNEETAAFKFVTSSHVVARRYPPNVWQLSPGATAPLTYSVNAKLRPSRIFGHVPVLATKI